MIRILDLEDSTEGTTRRQKEIKEGKKRDLVKDGIKRHETHDSIISHQSMASHCSSTIENDKHEQ